MTVMASVQPRLFFRRHLFVLLLCNRVSYIYTTISNRAILTTTFSKTAIQRFSQLRNYIFNSEWASMPAAQYAMRQQDEGRRAIQLIKALIPPDFFRPEIEYSGYYNEPTKALKAAEGYLRALAEISESVKDGSTEVEDDELRSATWWQGSYPN